MRWLILVSLPLLLTAGCATPTQLALDAEVRRLCAIDGGIRVYEQVKLPVEEFDQYGQINFYRPTQGENALGPEYLVKSITQYYQRGNPEVWRDHYQILRRSDGKLLGEAVSYSRRGGDIPGPWHSSSYGCPKEAGEVTLIKRIFIKDHNKTGETQ
ncbi:MAG: hypothetical protein AB1830_15640 [Pseudomonadota bacterium]